MRQTRQIAETRRKEMYIIVFERNTGLWEGRAPATGAWGQVQDAQSQQRECGDEGRKGVRGYARGKKGVVCISRAHARASVCARSPGPTFENGTNNQSRREGVGTKTKSATGARERRGGIHINHD